MARTRSFGRIFAWGLFFAAALIAPLAYAADTTPPSVSITAPVAALNFSFESDPAGSCPAGWTCAGDAKAASASDGQGCVVAAGMGGSRYLKAGCDATTGSATSPSFTLPAGISSVSFLRAGGADGPSSGLFVKRVSDNATLCAATSGTDSDSFYAESCAGLSSYAGIAAYIYVADTINAGWGKTYVDTIQLMDGSGNALTAVPVSGSPAAVSGTVVVSASASDDTGVAGVQFKVDGTNIVSEDTAPPYAVSWNSATVANGSHTLTAVARDAAGNVTTSASAGVTVSNISAPVITSPGSALGIVGSPFSYQITASGNPTSYSAAGLPPGLSVNTTSGLISGTPTAGGSYASTIRAVNGSGTGSASLAITTGASGGGGNAITGWAWSDNIGWVSLSGPGYGLAIAPDGKISGYMWSDNIGWIAADTACGAQAQVVAGGNFIGWFHALGTGGDGCISLSSANGGSSYTFGVKAVPNLSYSPVTSGGWASDTIGWLAFNLSASLAPASCVMNVAPATLYTMAMPSSITLSYTTQDTTSASIASAPSTSPAPGSVSPSGSSVSVAPPSAPAVSTTYTMTAYNLLGTPYTCGTTVTVNTGWPPPAGCISIGASNPTCLSPVIRTKNVRKGDTIGIFWHVDYAASCALTQNGGAVSGAPTTGANDGGFSVGPLTQRTDYVLTCPAQDGSTFVDRATINIIPEFQEI